MKECPTCLALFEDDTATCPADGSPLDQPFVGPRLIDEKYAIERRLGRGGMGSVYVTVHVNLERRFAIKVIRREVELDPSFARRFRREAHALGRLKHPRIVDVTDFGTDPRAGGLHYLVMELLDGVGLKEWSRGKRRSIPEVVEVLAQIAEGIDFAHGQGLLHRDLKPSNIFVSTDADERPRVKILDFGLARRLTEQGGDRLRPRLADLLPGHEVADADTQTVATDGCLTPHGRLLDLALPEGEGDPMTEPGTRAGTPAYMAPELVAGADASMSSDVYALGCVAFELFADRPPFVGPASKVLRDQLQSPAPRPSSLRADLPVELDPPLLWPLAKDPGLRPAHAAEVVSSLRDAWEGVERRRRGDALRRRQIATGALLLPAVVGVTLALSGSPPVRWMERLTLDLRMATSPRRPPDPRLLILSVDEASLLAEPRSLAEQADRFGRSLEHALRAGASGVAIDFLLPRRWSESQAFSQLVLGRQAQLTLAALSTPNGEVVGTECVSGLTAAALGPAALSRVFGFVNLSEDDDGVARQAHLLYRDREGRLRQTWAGRAMDTLDVPAARAPNGRPPFRIDFRVDWKRFGRVSWKDVDRRLAEEPDAFRRKLLLVGGEFAGAGDDFHRTPLGGSEAVSGVVLQALILNTLLEGTPIRDAEPALWAPALVLALGLVVACAIGVARRRDFVALSVSVGVALAGAGWMAFRVSALLIPLAGPLLGLILAGAAGRLARARLTVLSREVQ